jgi:hypothetical protein
MRFKGSVAYPNFKITLEFCRMKITFRYKDISCYVTCWKDGVAFPAGAIFISVLHIAQTGSATHQSSYSLDTGDYIR